MARTRTFREIDASDILVPLGVALLYVAAAKLGFALALQAPQVSAVCFVRDQGSVI